MKRAKRNWAISKWILLITMIYWFIETMYFILVFGWHLTAINQDEKTCDYIVEVGFTIGFALITITVLDVVQFILDNHCDHEYITDADWKSQTCRICYHKKII